MNTHTVTSNLRNYTNDLLRYRIIEHEIAGYYTDSYMKLRTEVVEI